MSMRRTTSVRRQGCRRRSVQIALDNGPFEKLPDCDALLVHRDRVAFGQARLLEAVEVAGRDVVARGVGPVAEMANELPQVHGHGGMRGIGEKFLLAREIFVDELVR
jgi:hypothetical protein